MSADTGPGLPDDIPSIFAARWRMSFAYDVAMDLLPDKDLMAQYQIGKNEFDELVANEDFQARVAKIKTELLEGGISLQTKAKMMVEMSLPHLYRMIRSTDSSDTTRLSAFDKLCEMAGINMGGGMAVSDGNSGPGLTIIYNAGNPERKAISVGPITMVDPP